MLWRMLWRTQALLLAVMVGCAGTSPVVRVDTESTRSAAQRAHGFYGDCLGARW